MCVCVSVCLIKIIFYQRTNRCIQLQLQTIQKLRFPHYRYISFHITLPELLGLYCTYTNTKPVNKEAVHKDTNTTLQNVKIVLGTAYKYNTHKGQEVQRALRCRLPEQLFSQQNMTISIPSEKPEEWRPYLIHKVKHSKGGRLVDCKQNLQRK